MSAMSNAIEKITSTLSELIAKEVEKTLGRLRAKIFEAAEIEDDIEIDLSKFAQNTAKKVTESDEFSKIINDVTSAVEKAEKAESPKKEKKDPDAPKGAKNAFIFFCNEKRQEVKEENSSLKATEITKKLGEMWKEEKEKNKERYQKMAEADKKRYADEIAEYEPKEGFKNPKASKKVKSTAPKRALSAYIFFCQDKRDEVKKKNPTLKSSEIMSELGKMWKSLSDKKKKPFEKLADDDKKRYSEEMKSYVPTEEEKAASAAKSKGKKVKGKEAKRSPSAYLLFCGEKRDQVKASNPDKKMTEITSILGKMWSELSDKKKKPYVEKAEKLKAEFEAAKEKDDKKKEKDAEDEEDTEEEEDAEDAEKDAEEEDDDEPLLGDDDDEEEEEEKPIIKKSKK